MRILALIESVAILIGILGMIAGQFFGIPKGLHLGVFLVGAGFALGGLESVLTARLGFRTSEDQFEAYAGAPAMIVGLMALIIGSALIGCAYLLSEGIVRSPFDYVARRPGLALIGGGLLVAGAGALAMLNPRGRRGIGWTLLVRVPRWILGFILVLAGFSAVGLGIWEWLEPRAFDQFIRNIPQQFDRHALERWWNSVR